MRTSVLFFVLFSFSSLLYSQNNGTIIGRILDASSSEVIEYAGVTLYLAKDSSLINGVVTDENGQFTFRDLKSDTVYIMAQFLGYETFQSNVFQINGSIDLGTINLGVNASVLQEIEVTGREITAFHRLDKQVFDAGQFQSAQGGNATDVLRNLPSISVNALGEISVRGATGFILMINGKPVQSDPGLMLSQIPANAIEDIEIITAPSAKYDPDGKAGIINIKTRQGVTDGLFLVANGLIGLPSIEPYDNAEAARRYGGDLTVNYKKGKWDLSAGLDYSRNDVSGRREGYVNTYLNEVLTEFPSDGERSFDRENYSGRAAVQYAPNERQSIGASFFAGKRTQYRTADILYLDQQRTRITEGQFLNPQAY